MTPEDLAQLQQFIDQLEQAGEVLFVMFAVSCAWIGVDARRKQLRLGAGGWTALVALWPFSVIWYLWRRNRRSTDKSDSR